MFWPDAEEKQEIKRRIREDSDWPHCIGFIDGTLIPLYAKPVRDGEDYYSVKGCYGIAGMVVCDDTKRIRHIYVGWPGCAHDQRVFTNSRLYLRPDQYFEGQEYLLADSGYTPAPTIVPAYKRLPHRQLTADESAFNGKLSSKRVTVEHCIGILKAKFQSLRGLRLAMDDENNAKRAVFWIRACCVLHNLLLDDPPEDIWIQSEIEESDVPGLEQINIPDATNHVADDQREHLGKQKRERLKHYMLSLDEF